VHNDMAWGESGGARAGMPGVPTLDGQGKHMPDPRRMGQDSQSGLNAYGSGAGPGPRNSAAGSMPSGGGQLSMTGGPGGVDMGKLSNLISAFQQQAQHGGGNASVSGATGLVNTAGQQQRGIMNAYGQNYTGQPYQPGPAQQLQGGSMGGMGHGNQAGNGQGGIQSLLANPALQQALQNINQGMGDGMRHQQNQQQPAQHQQQPAQHQQPYHVPGNSSRQPH
jgi:hypothetical protein